MNTQNRPRSARHGVNAGSRRNLAPIQIPYSIVVHGPKELERILDGVRISQSLAVINRRRNEERPERILAG